MTQNFPISPERIPDLIRLSIMNKKYEDITNYFKIFQTIESPSLQMQRYLSAGLATLGKYFVHNSESERAIEALQLAYKFSNGKYEILKNITESFEELKRTDVLLALFDKTDLDQWPKEVQALYFHALNLSSADDKLVILHGEKLLKNNITDIMIYKGVIERSIKIKRRIGNIEHLVLEAKKHFPDNAHEFDELMNKK